MEKKRPQLSIDELHQLRWLLGGLLALSAVWTVLYLEIDAWLLAGVATIALGAVLVRPELPARLPLLAHQLAFPFIAAFFAWDVYSTAELLPALIRLDILLLLYRGISYRRKRDDLQLIILGLFLVMVAGVLTVSLAFAVQILVFTGCTLAFLLVITLTEAAENANPGPGALRPGPPRNQVPAWARIHWRRFARRLRAVTDWRLLTVGGLLFVVVVALSALLFMSIPRFQLENSFFLDRFITKKSRTGFSDSIRFGDVIDIQQDDSVALRVDISDPTRAPVTPYWRMVVLDEYHAGVLRTSRRLQNELLVSAQMSTVVPGTLRAPRTFPVYWTFYFEAGISRHLPVTGSFSLLRFREPQWVQQQNSLRLIALRNEPVTMTAYRVDDLQTDGFVPDRLFGPLLRATERARPDDQPVHREGDEADRPRPAYPLTTLQLPGGADDRQALKQFVHAITGGADLRAEEFAARASRWLAEKHGYSLQVNLPEGDRDPVVRWMESGRPGHCELFTAAFTLLARAAGFPTRVITGFKGGDWNAYENYYMVRNTNAHAWCEVYDGRTGWFRVDPTIGAAAVTTTEQGSVGPAAITRRIDRSWQARLDAIRILWYRRIVSFDQRTQLALVTSLKEAAGNFGTALQDVLRNAGRAVQRWLRRPWHAPRILGWLGVAAAGAGAGLLWWRLGRPWWWRVWGARRPAGADPVRRKAGRFLVRFRARSAAGAPVNAGGVWADLQRLRYGSRETWPEPQAVFRRARRALRAERRPLGWHHSTGNHG
ncbi:MAG: transglutaminaseTgpA domain-containing protein [Opitutaceae bacterium]|nr:transglutaminaseTgpA domain-containing protein [Opitutaceae bacterium]